jgi:hypothetical protein
MSCGALSSWLLRSSLPLVTTRDGGLAALGLSEMRECRTLRAERVTSTVSVRAKAKALKGYCTLYTMTIHLRGSSQPQQHAPETRERNRKISSSRHDGRESMNAVIRAVLVSFV